MLNCNTSFPAVMGVINCSQDSFYAPAANVDAALVQAEQMVIDGADIIDIGAEATNPNVILNQGVISAQHEIDMLAPLVEKIASQFDVVVSVDTSRTETMQAVISAGAKMINDQRALEAAGSLEVIARTGAVVCLMHFPSNRVPGSTTCQQLIAQIKQELLCIIKRCTNAGIAKDKIIIDPGFGQGHYGKNIDENYYLLAQLEQLAAMGFPVLSGWSRKSIIGDVLGGVAAAQRLYGSVAAALLAVSKGARIVRVHDVKPTCDALKVWQKMKAMEV